MYIESIQHTAWHMAYRQQMVAIIVSTSINLSHPWCVKDTDQAAITQMPIYYSQEKVFSACVTTQAVVQWHQDIAHPGSQCAVTLPFSAHGVIPWSQKTVAALIIA